MSRKIMLTADYVIVGAGLTGSVIARLLADAGRDVLMLERRSEVGGNVHESMHESGIPYHTYGPHYFRTASERIWQFVNRFDQFRPFEARLMSLAEDEYVPWPIQSQFLSRKAGPSWKPEFYGSPRNFEEASLSMMPRVIYDLVVKGYTEKQWGVPASSLSAELAKRFDVRTDGDNRLSRHKYQGLPQSGYTAWMASMVQGIPLTSQFDYIPNRNRVSARRCLVFTGAIDEFFQYRFGKLKYRSQKRTHRFTAQSGPVQPCVQVNYPSSCHGPHVRSIEWIHLLPVTIQQAIQGTLITEEEPFDATEPNEYEYPFPDEENRVRYELYRNEASKHDGLLICGRLGEYRYLDMDQAIGRAITHGLALLSTT